MNENDPARLGREENSKTSRPAFTHCWFCHQFTRSGQCSFCGVDTETPIETRRGLVPNPLVSASQKIKTTVSVRAQKFRAKISEKRESNSFLVCGFCHQHTTAGICTTCGIETALSHTERREKHPHPLTKLHSRIKPLLANRRRSNDLIAPTDNSERPSSADYTTCWFCHQHTRRGLCSWCGIETETAAEDRTVLARRDVFVKIQHRFTPPLIKASQNIKLPLVRWNLWEHIVLGASLLKWSFLAGLIGVMAGTASAVFLLSLEAATSFRIAHPWLLWLLPVVGLIVGFVYHRWGKSVEAGNNLILDHIHEPAGGGVPILMAPLIYAATVLTHLFGGSAGREGTALQMGGSLAGWLSRKFSLRPEDTRLLLMAGMSAGFGSVFGVPLAGAVFGMEVQSVGRIRYDGIIPCLFGSIVGDWVCRRWGVEHGFYKIVENVSITPTLVFQLVIAGIVFGLVALLFSELTHAISEQAKRFIAWSPLRPAIGGVMIIALTYLTNGSDYLGLSLPLLSESVNGGQVLTYAFALKLLFTVVTLGFGFKGGEVTPLFVIGATLGYTLGWLMGVPPSLMASAGFIAVFAAAANTPITCFLMGIELFGGAYALPYGIVCVLAYVFSGHRGIYLAQRIEIPKSKSLPHTSIVTLREVRDNANVVPFPVGLTKEEAVAKAG